EGGGVALRGVGGEGVQAAGQELAEVALDGGAGDAGQAGDVVVGQPLGLEPEDFQLALHERLGVVLALERNGRQVVRGEGDARHGRFLAWLQPLSGHRSTQAEVAGKCLKLCRREYNWYSVTSGRGGGSSITCRRSGSGSSPCRGRPQRRHDAGLHGTVRSGGNRGRSWSG